MSATSRPRSTTLALTLLAAVALAGCGGSSSGSAGSAAPSSSSSPSGSESPVVSLGTCPGAVTAVAKVQPPSDVPLPGTTAKAYEYDQQGATKLWFFAFKGAPQDLVTVRDAYVKALRSQGYVIKHVDQEVNAEAEAEFGGAHHGSANVRPLCQGKLVFRLKLTS